MASCTFETVRGKIISIIEDYYGTDPGAITGDTRFDALANDLAHKINVADKIEEEFGIAMSMLTLDRYIHTVREMVNYVMHKLACK